MNAPDFASRLSAAQERCSSVLCVGLDPDPERLPVHLLERYSLGDAVIAFNRAIVEATHEFACAFKLNLAFFEILEEEAWRVLSETLACIPRDTITIADGKRGDVGHSARLYAASVFDRLDFDACTVSAYLGRDSVEPFLAYEGRCVFLLARTSNPGGSDFQELRCDGERLYEIVARTSRAWSAGTPASLGYVVGGTQPEALRAVRKICPDEPLLVPGIGAQGGVIADVLSAASQGPLIVNSSRQVLYAAPGADFAAAAAAEAGQLREHLNAHRA